MFELDAGAAHASATSGAGWKSTSAASARGMPSTEPPSELRTGVGRPVRPVARRLQQRSCAGHPPGDDAVGRSASAIRADNNRLAVVRPARPALGTSAATFQHLEYNGRKLGHILDPRTGWPAEGIASATAIAPTAAEADALATAFFILGVEKTRAYCAEPSRCRGRPAARLPECYSCCSWLTSRRH